MFLFKFVIITNVHIMIQVEDKKDEITFEDFKTEVLNDYKIARM